jgi:hypothetical protein
MNRSSRKLIAVLMLLWLPLFSTNALAAALSMQLQQGGCHEAAAMQTMSHADMGEHHMHHGAPTSEADEHSPICSDCGFCQVAGSGYLAVADTQLLAPQTAARATTPYLVTFHSVTSAPLVPPPLVRA